MIKHWKYSICQLPLIICIFKRRKTKDFLILYHCAINSLTVTPSHITLSRKVMIAWRCKAFTALYSGNPLKKLGFRVLQRWRLFLFRVSLFFTRFHSSFLLIIAVISSKRPTNKKHIILGFVSHLAALKQPSVPQNWSQMDDRSRWKKICRAQFVNMGSHRSCNAWNMANKGRFKTSKSPLKSKRLCDHGLTWANCWIVRIHVSRHCFWRIRCALFTIHYICLVRMQFVHFSYKALYGRHV